MKKLNSFLLFAWIIAVLPAFGQKELSNSVLERESFYINGVEWQAFDLGGLMIMKSNTPVQDRGQWHRLDIMLINETNYQILFDPANITSFYYRNNTRNYLNVWSRDDFMRRVRRRQNWESVLHGVSEGIAVENAGTTTSHTSVTTHHSRGIIHSNAVTTTRDAAAIAIAQEQSNRRLAAVAAEQSNERDRHQIEYLARNTIFPNSSLSGYVYVERSHRRAEVFIVQLSIDNEKLIFEWEL